MKEIKLIKKKKVGRGDENNPPAPHMPGPGESRALSSTRKTLSERDFLS